MGDIGTYENACLAAALGLYGIEALWIDNDNAAARHDLELIACEAASWEISGFDSREFQMMHRVRHVGTGESREAWLIDGVVYKYGRTSANEYEHEMLSAWRFVGAHWAPETTLWDVSLGTAWGDEQYRIVAMTYIPDDGTCNKDDLDAITAAAPETCSENYHTCNGRTYLIDGVDIERMPTLKKAENKSA